LRLLVRIGRIGTNGFGEVGEVVRIEPIRLGQLSHGPGEDLIYNLPARSQLWRILTADIILCHKGYRFRLG
jgi:hypothetical protein